MPWARGSRRPSAGASSTGTPSSIAAGASSCSPRAATAGTWPTASSTPWPTRGPRARCFLELRAAASLARLRRDEGADGRLAVACLRAAYAGFPRGLDAPDLRDARALLAATP